MLISSRNMVCERIRNTGKRAGIFLERQKEDLKGGLMAFRQSEEAFFGIHLWGKFIDKWIDEREANEPKVEEEKVSEYHIKTLF